MARSLKKGPYVDEKLFRKIMRMKEGGMPTMSIRTWSRACTIVPEFVGYHFEVHTGRSFHKLFVTEDMVGHKLGEFAQTRTFRGHSGTKKTAKG